MWECKHCLKEYDFKTTSQKANHSRWCDSNPKKYNSDKMKKSIKDKKDLKFGKITEFKVKCFKCKNDFIVLERSKKFPVKKHYFCSDSCSHSRILNQKSKKKISKGLEKFYKKNEHHRKNMILNNGVYIKKEKRKCKNCKTIITNKNKVFCSFKCKKINGEKNLKGLRLYRIHSSFTHNLSDFKEEYDFSLIEKYGWYKAKNRGDNDNGVSRDHIMSVKYGYDNNIATWIISHPANCQLKRHKENVSKNSKCEITLEDLLLKIEKWNKKYIL